MDFKKAFDSIPHQKMFFSMINKGLKGKVIKVLASMYSNLKACIQLDDRLTRFIRCDIGTRQGDISSPIIFNLFINDLCTLLRQQCRTGIFITNSIPDILCLAYADDFANCVDKD